MFAGKAKGLLVVAVIVTVCAGASAAWAQHSFQSTKTVDPSGNADYTTIQAAIDAFGATSAKKTVLIYSGTYNENVTLDGRDENIDLVGIDRDAVIIAPSSGDAIVITSGTETSRNNSIRNLTIKTTSGHGIEIVKGGTPPPKDIIIENVTIEAAGTAMDGISGEDAEEVRVFNCDITATGSGFAYGIKAGKYWTIESTFAEAKSSDGQAMHVRDHSVVRACHCRANNTGLHITGDGVRVESGVYEGGSIGVVLGAAQNVVLRDCLMRGDYSIADTVPQRALLADHSGNDNMVLKGCRLEAIGNGRQTLGVWHDQGTMRLEDCSISAVNLAGGDDDRVIGVSAAAGGKTLLIGGSIATRSDEEKETQVWDVFATSATGCRLSGTRLSKCIGAMSSAERPRPVVQRMLNVSTASADAILTATLLLPSSEQPDVSPTGQPDVYRVLKVTGNQAGMSQDVYIIGTDFAGNDITDKITLAGTTPQDGVKPFKTVAKIILPGASAPGQTVSVGTTDKLGLYYPISAGTQVIQEARLVSGVYTVQTTGTVDATYSTVTPSTFNAGDSFEWVVLASQ